MHSKNKQTSKQTNEINKRTTKQQHQQWQWNRTIELIPTVILLECGTCQVPWTSRHCWNLFISNQLGCFLLCQQSRCHVSCLKSTSMFLSCDLPRSPLQRACFRSGLMRACEVWVSFCENLPILTKCIKGGLWCVCGGIMETASSLTEIIQVLPTGVFSQKPQPPCNMERLRSTASGPRMNCLDNAVMGCLSCLLLLVLPTSSTEYCIPPPRSPPSTLQTPLLSILHPRPKPPNGFRSSPDVNNSSEIIEQTEHHHPGWVASDECLFSCADRYPLLSSQTYLSTSNILEIHFPQSLMKIVFLCSPCLDKLTLARSKE